MFVLTVLLEAGKSLVLYLQLRLKQNPLTYGRNAQSETSINHDRSAIFSALLIPTSVAQIKRQRSVRRGRVLQKCAQPNTTPYHCFNSAASLTLTPLGSKSLHIRPPQISIIDNEYLPTRYLRTGSLPQNRITISEQDSYLRTGSLSQNRIAISEQDIYIRTGSLSQNRITFSEQDRYLRTRSYITFHLT